jgi:hypothetical protein
MRSFLFLELGLARFKRILRILDVMTCADRISQVTTPKILNILLNPANPNSKKYKSSPFATAKRAKFEISVLN